MTRESDAKLVMIRLPEYPKIEMRDPEPADYLGVLFRLCSLTSSYYWVIFIHDLENNCITMILFIMHDIL